MERYVAFLRGMNLGGRRIKNDELRREFEVLGFADVACFRASGNVIFGAEEGDEVELTSRIEAGLEESLGYEVPVFLRSADELRAIAASEPFEASLVAASKGKLQVAFLLDAADEGATESRPRPGHRRRSPRDRRPRALLAAQRRHL